jgi:diketogulonate reductase-like aldo/keto reductase
MKWRRVVLFIFGNYERRFIVPIKVKKMTRREATKLIGAGAAGLVLPITASICRGASESSSMLSRAIPTTGEMLPVIGLGTWNVFDVELDAESEKRLGNVLTLFVKLGGRLIDSSPMYGRAEEVVGTLAAKVGIRDRLFLATKVWTRGKQSGIDSMERSMSRLQANKIDLMQVHNLVDLSTQLATMREWKAQARFRYIGITHYNSTAFEAVEKALTAEQVDFLQINYSIMEREAESRILPLALERKVAVIINRPFGGGDLFSRVRAKPLPAWAREFDCSSWAQFFLKWILAHPAVTCAIPATNNPEHLEDNMRGGMGQLPDAEMRRRMTQFVASL